MECARYSLNRMHGGAATPAERLRSAVRFRHDDLGLRLARGSDLLDTVGQSDDMLSLHALGQIGP